MPIEPKLANALVHATNEIIGAVKDGSNPHFRSSYATLESVIDAVRAPLFKYGLTFVQVVHTGDSAKVETILLHESGESISMGICEVPVDKKSAHAYGSALTYARRYSLACALGVPQVDDDAIEAIKETPKAVLYKYKIPNSDLTQKRQEFLAENAKLTKTSADYTEWESKVSFGDKMEKYRVSELNDLIRENGKD